MFNQNISIIIFICILIFGIGLWYYYQQNNTTSITTMSDAIVAHNTEQMAPLPPPINQETANIERQIEQVLAFRDPPEIIKLKELEHEFEKDSTRWDILIAVGDIYRKGAFPRFLPNEEIALKCYKISSSCPDGKVAGIGQSKYVETRDDPIDNGDRAGEPLPTDIGLRICAIAESAIQTTPWHLFEKPSMMMQKTNVQEPMPIYNDDDNYYEELLWTTNQAANYIIPEYRFDGQNVHDHSVSKVTQFNINELKTESTGNTNNINFDNIKNSILTSNDIDSKTKEDALHVIDHLSESKHSSFNITEKQTLAMVWDKINNQPENVKNNLKETLAKQLASSVENGHIVCSSGKISRIMSTLDGVSNESVRPMWAIREELGTLASQIRDNMTKEFGDTPEAGRRIQETFEKEVKDQYIKKLGMSEKIMNPIIEEYKLGF